MTFDVDGAVGWIRGEDEEVLPPWVIGFGPWDEPTPAYIIRKQGIKCGEAYTQPDPGGGSLGYHAPYQGSWHGPVLTGATGTSMSAYDIPWTQRPGWSPCGGLDSTQYGGATIETWWPVELPAVPANVSLLRVTIGIAGNWYKQGAFMGIGGTWTFNQECLDKTVELRYASDLPNSFEYGTLIGSHVISTDGTEYIRGSIAVSPADEGRIFYIALTQLPSEHFTKGSVHCSLGFDAIEYPSLGGGDSWMVTNSTWVWEWVISNGPTVYVSGVDLSSLPIISDEDMPEVVEVRQACSLFHGGGTAEGVDENHVVAPTPITTVAKIDASNGISLLSPTVLPVTSLTWKFRMSHVFQDAPLYAQGLVYQCRDYSYDPIANMAFLTYEQSVQAAYEHIVTEQESLSATGGVSNAMWEVVTIGYGYGVLKVGAWTSAPFLIYDERWYGLTMQFPSSGEVSCVLGDYDSGDILASIIYPMTGSAEMAYTGGVGVAFTPTIEVGFDEITITGVFTEPSTETYVPPEPDIGWNTEYVKVENGGFSIEAQPAAGSVKVESFENGLLDYPEDWEEADDTGISYVCRTDDILLSVTYLVREQFLENRISVQRPTQQEAQQHMRINML